MKLVDEEVQKRLLVESEDDERSLGRRERRAPLYARLLGYTHQFADRSLTERRLVSSVAAVGVAPDRKRIQSLYWDISRDLNRRKAEALMKTKSEKAVLIEIQRKTKLHYITNSWIAHRNFDGFFPMISGVLGKGTRHHGLAIEVNGEIHNSLGKMKKDTSKEEMLHRLGIALLTIENSDVRSPVVMRIIESLNNLPRLDTRARQRVMMRVYLETIICNASDWQLSELFGIDFKKHQILIQNQINKGDAMRDSDSSCGGNGNTVNPQPNCSLTIEWLDSKRAADFLGLSVGSLRNMTSNGQIRYYKLGNRNRYLLEDLRGLLVPTRNGDRNGHKN